MAHSLKDRALTLAGVFLAAELVHRTATQGRQIDTPVETALASLFKIDVDNVEEIYGDVGRLQPGLNSMVTQMSQQKQKVANDVTRYVILLLHLEQKLAKKPELLDKIAAGLITAKEQVEFFSLTHENVVANLADLYQQTISTLQPKIIVRGAEGILEIPANASLIRALLLCGIRSARAWRQCGGSRWQLLFKRKTLLGEARKALQKLPSIDTRV
jgi:high frequency lysogenization protein